MAGQGLLAHGVPAMPPWLLYIKGAIIVLSLIILALSAYGLSLYSGVTYGYYSSGVPGYLIFLAIKTWIIYGVSIALELTAPQLYYRVILLIAYVLSVIFWLSGWAWSASWAATILSLYSGSRYYGTLSTFGSVMAACAGIGALIWILSIVHLAFFIMACLRSPDSTATAPNLELGAQKQSQSQTQSQTVVYPQQQQQPVYVQQPGYPQQQPVYVQPQQVHPQQVYATQ